MIWRFEMTQDIPAMMADIGKRARAAAEILACASSERKYAALIHRDDMVI